MTKNRVKNRIENDDQELWTNIKLTFNFFLRVNKFLSKAHRDVGNNNLFVLRPVS